MVLLGLIASMALAQAPSLPRPSPLPFPPGNTDTINIVNWSGADFPKVVQRSEQLPLTDEELAKLAKAGFDSAQMVKMVEERRCACDASADGLIKLKQAGVPKAVLAAVSLHALKPNQRLTLAVTLDFTGESREAREAYLYFFIDDGPLTRVFSANLNDVLSGRTQPETMVDRSDLLITKKVRRVQFAGDVVLKKYGKHNVMVAASANPTLTHPSQLTEAEKQNAQNYVFDYPRASMQSLCRLTAGYKRDAVLTYKWRYMGSRFECEWD
ncbi:MAG: hypothetical protein K1X64_17935 [Myxococcaceae bacterium]|nr:hypothetical protein [Myxococcaceae bacterium]